MTWHWNWLLFYWLVGGHVLMDYPLQSEFLALGKSRHTPVPGVHWTICLTAHAWLHGMAVTALTGSVALGLAEFVLHWVIDLLKNESLTNIWVDQALHIACKVLWTVLAPPSGVPALVGGG
jgi:hypothetical protein